MKTSKFILYNLIGVAVAAVAAVVVTAICIDIYTNHGQGVEVPDLHGKLFTDARHLLEERGLIIEVQDSGFNKTLPADCVLEQTPGVGAKVKEGHVIRVTVNSPNSPMLTIPDIIDNSSRRQATARLTAMGFKLLEPEMIPGEKDWVYGVKCRGKNLVTGDHVSADIPLRLVVGDGQYDESDGINVSDDQVHASEELEIYSSDDVDDFEVVQ